MSEQRRIESCRDCHWWSADPGYRYDETMDCAECHALRPTLVKDGDTTARAEWPYTSPDDFCPKFQRWDGGRVFRPDVCGGCYNAQRVVEEIRKAIRGDNWDVRDMLSSEAYREREEAHNRVYKRVDELIQMLVTSTETSE